MNESPTVAVQARIMRTYEVTLKTEAGAVVGTETVNLSYEVNEALDALDRDGTIVPATSIQASIEVMKRLRKLAERNRTAVTAAQIDEADWDVRLARFRFVQVPLDESGRPIPQQP